MGKVIHLFASKPKNRKLPLTRLIHEIFEDIKKRQDDILRKKTDFLYKEAYRYFLDQYLMRVTKNQIIDLPPFMYETGKVICKEAQANAERVMLNVIKDNRVNECYTKRVKEIRNLK